MILWALVWGIPAAVGIASAALQDRILQGMRVPALVSVPDSVGSGLYVVTSGSWDCPPLPGKDEPQHFPPQDAGRVLT